MNMRMRKVHCHKTNLILQSGAVQRGGGIIAAQVLPFQEAAACMRPRRARCSSLSSLNPIIRCAQGTRKSRCVAPLANAYPEGARSLACVRRGQDFEKAGQLRDREMELKAKIQAVIAGAKEASKAEAESLEAGGPQVTEQDIANIVAQWTGEAGGGEAVAGL